MISWDRHQDPDVKIEGIIAIGKAKDRRAVYLLDQLANDPNTTIAFAATEVIQKLENRAPLKKDSLNAHAPVLPAAISDKKINEGNWDKFMDEDTTSPPPAKVSQSAALQQAPVAAPVTVPKTLDSAKLRKIAKDDSTMKAEDAQSGEKSAEELANMPAVVAADSTPAAVKPVPAPAAPAVTDTGVKKNRKKPKNE